MVSFKFRRSLKKNSQLHPRWVDEEYAFEDTQLLMWQGGNTGKMLTGTSAKPPWDTLPFCLEPVLFISLHCQIAKWFASSKGGYARYKVSFLVQQTGHCTLKKKNQAYITARYSHLTFTFQDQLWKDPLTIRPLPFSFPVVVAVQNGGVHRDQADEKKGKIRPN